jgi:hypothetical protein
MKGEREMPNNNNGIPELRRRYEGKYESKGSEGRESTSASTMSISLSPPPSPESKSCINIKRVTSLGKSIQPKHRKDSLTPIHRSMPLQSNSTNHMPSSASREVEDDDDIPFDQKLSLRPKSLSKSPSRSLSSPQHRDSNSVQKTTMLVQRPFDETSAFGETASLPPYDETSIAAFGEASTLLTMGDDTEMIVVGSLHTSEKQSESPRKLQVLRPLMGSNNLCRSVSPPTKRNPSEMKILSQIHDVSSAKSPIETLSPVDSEASTRFMTNSEEVLRNQRIVSLKKLQTLNEYDSSLLSAPDSVPSHQTGMAYLKAPTISYAKRSNEDDDDQDSLLRSDDEIRKQVSKQQQGSSTPTMNRVRKMRRSRPTRDIHDDDSSLDAQDSNMDVHKSLQHRAQQAYQRRNRFLNNKVSSTASRASSNQAKSHESTSQSERKQKSYNQANILQPKIPQEDMSDNESYGGENETFATRHSIDSLYTKSMESEVEDLFRDLFFVGNGRTTRPGRRPVRFKNKSRYCDDDEDTNGSDTYLTEDRTAITEQVHSVSTSIGHDSSKENTETKQSESSTQPNQVKGPLNVVLQALEGGVNLVAEALGIYAPCSPSRASPEPQAEEINSNVYAPRVFENSPPNNSQIEIVPDITDTKRMSKSSESSVSIIDDQEEEGITLPHLSEEHISFSKFTCMDTTADSILGELLLDEVS